MKAYKYELIVYHKVYDKEYGNTKIKIKRFLGNDINILQERFEMWFVKQPYDREDTYIHIGEVQHANYKWIK